jgi:hypothetical protein
MGYWPSYSLFCVMGDLPINCRLIWGLHFIDFGRLLNHISITVMFCLFNASHLRFHVFLQHFSHILWSVVNWGSFSVIQGSMFLMLFRKLLFPLPSNGLQLKALVMQDPIISVNTLHQQNLRYEENMLNFVLFCWLSKHYIWKQSIATFCATCPFHPSFFTCCFRVHHYSPLPARCCKTFLWHLGFGQSQVAVKRTQGRIMIICCPIFSNPPWVVPHTEP